MARRRCGHAGSDEVSWMSRVERDFLYLGQVVAHSLPAMDMLHRAVVLGKPPDRADQAIAAQLISGLRATQQKLLKGGLVYSYVTQSL